MMIGGGSLVWLAYQIPDSFAIAVAGICVFFVGLIFVGDALAKWRERDG